MNYVITSIIEEDHKYSQKNLEKMSKDELIQEIYSLSNDLWRAEGELEDIKKQAN